MKETLEEVVEKLFPVFNRSTPFGSKYPWTPHKEREVFKKGVKWQQKRSYSEEEVLEILKNYDREFKLDTFAYTKSCTFTVKEWFEQFKKK